MKPFLKYLKISTRWLQVKANKTTEQNVTNFRNYTGLLIISTLLLTGCSTVYGEKRTQWDLKSSQEDMELTVKKHLANDPAERQQLEERLNDLNYKWHVTLGNSVEEKPRLPLNDKARDSVINQLIDKNLREGVTSAK